MRGRGGPTAPWARLTAQNGQQERATPQTAAPPPGLTLRPRRDACQRDPGVWRNACQQGPSRVTGPKIPGTVRLGSPRQDDARTRRMNSDCGEADAPQPSRAATGSTTQARHPPRPRAEAPRGRAPAPRVRVFIDAPDSGCRNLRNKIPRPPVPFPRTPPLTSWPATLPAHPGADPPNVAPRSSHPRMGRGTSGALGTCCGRCDYSRGEQSHGGPRWTSAPSPNRRLGDPAHMANNRMENPAQQRRRVDWMGSP